MDPREADESVAEKFTRVMNATPSPLGAWSDLTLASALSGAILLIALFAIRRSGDPASLYVALGVAAVPPIVSGLFSLSLRGSRKTVVAWLRSVPFPIDNMNALLAGLGDTIEVFFDAGAALPTRADLQPKLEAISDDVLLVKERADERSLEIRLGVIDSKRMPLLTNHRRYVRLVQVVEGALVPLSKSAPIRRVLVV
jgi:hypothetical protein